ncbi:MAG: uracil-DNA glycosylase family protein [Pseudomonadota bacterium]
MARIKLGELLDDVRACRHCVDDLPHDPRPVLQLGPAASILIAGQAPGAKVHASGVPFDDASGDRLRDWMGIDRDVFYDPNRIAILPMGLCYPGKGRSGDLPPLPQCAALWRTPLLERLPGLALTLVIGQYAQDWHLGKSRRSLTATVADWASYGDALLPLPHPSPRNNIWLKKNPWFEAELLPVLRARVRAALAH